MVTGNLSPAKTALDDIPLLIHPGAGTEQGRWHGVLPPWQSRDKCGHCTQRYTCPAVQREPCLLPARGAPQCLRSLGGAVIFQCNFIAERPESTAVSLQMSDNPLLSQTDRNCYLIPAPNPVGGPQENGSLSMGRNSRAISRPHCILNVLLVHTDT